MRYPEHIPGTKDYWGNEAQRLLEIATACASTFELYGYERIILPILERSDIFLQRSGEEIRNRMYMLRDPRGREMCLRPEMTISAARVFLERMSSCRLPVRLSYQGEVFRYDKIKEGRYRQFLQAGVECIGSENRVAADVEAVTLALEIFPKVGVSDFYLLVGDLEVAADFINSLPIPSAVRAHLLQYFWRREALEKILGRLAAQSETDSKPSGDPATQELAEILSSLGARASLLIVRQILSLFVEREIGQRDLDEIAERFLQRFSMGEGAHVPKECLDAVKEYLSLAGEPDAVLCQAERLIRQTGASPGPSFEALHRRLELLKKVTLPGPIRLDLGFRRAIEYYTGFVFEIHCARLGSSISQVCGGGRYDRLLSSLGAPRSIPAVGFAIGLERLLLALKAEGDDDRPKETPVDAVLTCVGQVDDHTAWKIAQLCRQAGWRVRIEIDRRRLGTVLRHVSEAEIPYAIIAGENELHNHCVKIREMTRHKEEIVAIDSLTYYVQESIEKDKLHKERKHLEIET